MICGGILQAVRNFCLLVHKLLLKTNVPKKKSTF